MAEHIKPPAIRLERSGTQVTAWFSHPLSESDPRRPFNLGHQATRARGIVRKMLNRELSQPLDPTNKLRVAAQHFIPGTALWLGITYEPEHPLEED